MSSFVTVLLQCPACVDERPFVQPDCVDGHAADCPEWMCLDCGTAVLQFPVSAGVVDDAPVPVAV